MAEGSCGGRSKIGWKEIKKRWPGKYRDYGSFIFQEIRQVLRRFA